MQPRNASPQWRWAVAGAILGLALAVFLFLPASLLASGVQRATRGHLLLQDPVGTVWNGSARLTIAGGVGSNDASTLPGRVNWRLRPTWTGARARIQAECCTDGAIRLVARRTGGAWRLQVADAQSRWPAEVLSGLGTPWNTLSFEGELEIATRGLSVEWTGSRLAVAGQADLVARRLSSRLSTLRPMGSYRIIVQGGTTPTLQLQTLEGSLQLSGAGQWAGSRLRFQGEASAAPEREAALSNLLNIIGRREGSRTLISIG